MKNINKYFWLFAIIAVIGFTITCASNNKSASREPVKRIRTEQEIKEHIRSLEAYLHRYESELSAERVSEINRRLREVRVELIESYPVREPIILPTGAPEGLRYRVIGERVATNGFDNKNANMLRIPSEIEGLPVTHIGALQRYYDVRTGKTDAYISGFDNLYNIIIPDSVINIQYGSFNDCIWLYSITLGNSVRAIGDRAFEGCSLLKNINIPNSVTTIEEGAFSGCANLTSINIPNRVTIIKDNTFRNTGLTGIVIPNSVTAIGANAFSGSALTSITIPNSVTSIGNSAFSGCKSLTSVVIPNSVVSIGENAFSGCTSLANIIIPDSVTGSIERSTFWGCTSLTNVIIGNSVTTIRDAFNDCTSLINVTIGNSVTSISNRAFYNCNNLTSITFKSADTSFSASTFPNGSTLHAAYTSANGGIGTYTRVEGGQVWRKQ